jgi:hypothetical protein
MCRNANKIRLDKMQSSVWHFYQYKTQGELNKTHRLHSVVIRWTFDLCDQWCNGPEKHPRLSLGRLRTWRDCESKGGKMRRHLGAAWDHIQMAAHIRFRIYIPIAGESYADLSPEYNFFSCSFVKLEVLEISRAGDLHNYDDSSTSSIKPLHWPQIRKIPCPRLRDGWSWYWQ